LALALGRAVETFLFEEKKYTVASKQTVVELEVRQPAPCCTCVGPLKTWNPARHDEIESGSTGSRDRSMSS
jgi:hypothetical protein